MEAARRTVRALAPVALVAACGTAGSEVTVFESTSAPQPTGWGITRPSSAAGSVPSPTPTLGTPVASTRATGSAPASRSATSTSSSARATSGTGSSRPAAASTSTPSRPVAAAPSGTPLRAFVTAYTWFDNDPPGPAIASPVIHGQAGGSGTYADPVTLAVAEGRFASGTRFYLPHVRRYFIVEDTCASCGERDVWVDMWIDGRHGDEDDVTACAHRLTGTFTIEVSPPSGRAVSSGPLYGNNGCTG